MPFSTTGHAYRFNVVPLGSDPLDPHLSEDIGIDLCQGDVGIDCLASKIAANWSDHSNPSPVDLTSLKIPPAGLHKLDLAATSPDEAVFSRRVGI